MWREGDLVRKGGSSQTPVRWTELQILPVLRLHLAYDNPLQKSWAQPFSDAKQLVLPAVPLWNFLADHRFIESLIAPMAKGYCSNSKTAFPVIPWCLPSSVLCISTALSEELLPPVRSLGRAHLKLSIEYPLLIWKPYLFLAGWFCSLSRMLLQESYSAGDKELCFHLHHVCTAEANKNHWWFCWKTLPSVWIPKLTACLGITEQHVQ